VLELSTNADLIIDIIISQIELILIAIGIQEFLDFERWVSRYGLDWNKCSATINISMHKLRRLAFLVLLFRFGSFPSPSRLFQPAHHTSINFYTHFPSDLYSIVKCRSIASRCSNRIIARAVSSESSAFNASAPAYHNLLRQVK
jgi:hypothetical protein